MTTLNLEASKKVYELLGDTYETENEWKRTKSYPFHVNRKEWRSAKETRLESFNTPTFPELIRLLPKIGEKKGWLKTTFCMGDVSARTVGEDLTWLYMNAPTEEQGMEEVSKYLLKVL